MSFMLKFQYFLFNVQRRDLGAYDTMYTKLNGSIYKYIECSYKIIFEKHFEVTIVYI